MDRVLIDDVKINIVKDVLKSGAIVMHPTETCYGLAVDIFDEEALMRLYAIKEMDFSKPVSILVSDLKMAEKYAVFSKKALCVAKKFWPGPLSIILKKTDFVPKHFCKGTEYISLRCPSHKFSLDMVEALGGAVTTTSANIAGEMQLYGVSNYAEIISRVDFLVDGGDLNQNLPSTIIKIDGDDLLCIREGELKFSEIERVFREC